MTSPLQRQYPRILSIDPSPKGFGFVVLEGGNRLVDWGIAEVWSASDQEFLVRIDRLVARYHPVLIVVEDLSATKHRKRARRRLIGVLEYAAEQGIPTARVTRAAVRLAFAEFGTTKIAIANALASEFPELAPRLPRARRPWQTEDERMNIFDALSFVAACPLQRVLRNGHSC